MYIKENTCVKCGKIFQYKTFEKGKEIPYHWCFSCFIKWNNIENEMKRKCFCMDKKDDYGFLDSDEEE